MALYDAFISYSHAKDKPIAAALQSAVQKLGKPWYRRRALRIFRDDTSLSATPQLWPSIERALADSRFLILLASPEAAVSHWVGKEVSYWLEHKGADTLLIALTDGTLVWDDASGDFGRHETGPLPAALRGRFPSEPKWEDMSAYRGGAAPRDAKFIDLAANFAAAIHGLPKEDLLSQEVRQQRRALMLAWSAAGSLFVIGGLAVWQWTLAAEQRNRAERTLATATRTTDTLVFDLAQAFRRRTGMPVDLVQLILKRVQELQTQLSEAGERTPELLRLQAVALDELYSTYVSLGDSKSALETAERGRAILESLLKAAPGNIQYQRDLAVAINNIGDARFATTAKWDEALAVYRQAMAIIEKLVTALPNSAIFQRDLSFCLNKIADMLLLGGQRDEALASYRRSLSITEMLAAKEPRRLDLQSDLAFTHNRIALLLSETGQVAAALDESQAIVEIREKLVAADARNSTWQRDLFLGLSRIGDVLATLARNAEALATFTRALSIIEALAATDLANTQWQRDVSIAYDQIGDVRLSARQPQ
ncbi:MAG: hypothetical protein QOC56_1599, partial [Alphaproteobacteria bacterium]|nr:hypothetical protein [Alphaproteobacteria bacterium]